MLKDSKPWDGNRCLTTSWYKQILGKKNEPLLNTLNAVKSISAMRLNSKRNP